MKQVNQQNTEKNSDQQWDETLNSAESISLLTDMASDALAELEEFEAKEKQKNQENKDTE